MLDTVLLFALPASGKSEVRTYMNSLSADVCESEMHMGSTLQLDDYPYVHFMHRIDDELYARGIAPIFFKGPTRPFLDGFEWGTLIHLLNEDYDDLMEGRTFNVPSAAQRLFDRLDEAHAKAGLPRALGEVPYRIRSEVAGALEDECAKHLAELNDTNSQDKKGKTIIIEAARGGPNGAAYPLTPPQGYQYSLSVLSEQILDRAGILYVWVTPEQSRQKNIERGRPDGQGSILFHSVPMEVMLGEYGCDDMDYLISQSDRPNTVRVERIVPEGNRYVTRTWHIPMAPFDNRDDLTSFIREDRENWNQEDIDKIHKGLSGALGTLADLHSG